MSQEEVKLSNNFLEDQVTKLRTRLQQLLTENNRNEKVIQQLTFKQMNLPHGSENKAKQTCLVLKLKAQVRQLKMENEQLKSENLAHRRDPKSRKI